MFMMRRKRGNIHMCIWMSATFIAMHIPKATSFILMPRPSSIAPRSFRGVELSGFVATLPSRKLGTLHARKRSIKGSLDMQMGLSKVVSPPFWPGADSLCTRHIQGYREHYAENKIECAPCNFGSCSCIGIMYVACKIYCS
jgi:hypothetical protein